MKNFIKNNVTCNNIIRGFVSLLIFVLIKLFNIINVNFNFFQVVFIITCFYVIMVMCCAFIANNNNATIKEITLIVFIFPIAILFAILNKILSYLIPFFLILAINLIVKGKINKEIRKLHMESYGAISAKE